MQQNYLLVPVARSLLQLLDVYHQPGYLRSCFQVLHQGLTILPFFTVARVNSLYVDHHMLVEDPNMSQGLQS